MEITRGTLVLATTASGGAVRMRAVSAPQQGRDFPVVWVCTEEEFARAQTAGEEPDSLPWPLSAVKVAQLA